MAKSSPNSLSDLPIELLSHILSFLSPPELAQAACISRGVKTLADSELFWESFVRQNLPAESQVQSPTPCGSWKELYASHHPYWFLPKHKIWVADRSLGGGGVVMGGIILTRYDPRTGCIDGYRLVANHGQHEFHPWAYDHDVIIHTFKPLVSMYLDDPVIRLKVGAARATGRIQEETSAQDSSEGSLKSSISLCRPISPELQSTSMQLWPPRKIPAKQRVRSDSGSTFRGEGHRPNRWKEASDRTFRIRKLINFNRRSFGMPSVSIGESVMTFSTLLEESYQPSSEKPWQGLWVGDYSGHGCEFLLVQQKRVRTQSQGIIPRSWRPEEFDVLEMTSSNDLDEELRNNPRIDEPSEPSPPLPQDQSQENKDTGHVREPVVYNRLEAIKLTGDPNVPRGQYTWIAEDIGPRGLVRIAQEEPFQGARIVRSFGHTAARGFRNGGSFAFLRHLSIPLTIPQIASSPLSLSWSLTMLSRSIGR